MYNPSAIKSQSMATVIILSGTVDANELKRAFEKMDVHVTQQEVDLLLKR